MSREVKMPENFHQVAKLVANYTHEQILAMVGSLIITNDIRPFELSSMITTTLDSATPEMKAAIHLLQFIQRRIDGMA